MKKLKWYGIHMKQAWILQCIAFKFEWVAETKHASGSVVNVSYNVKVESLTRRKPWRNWRTAFNRQCLISPIFLL